MYDLHKLGWHSFQQLCLTITREVLGQTVQSFLDTNDGGRDGAFVGRWSPHAGENLCGEFVIQCKFSAKPKHLLKPSELADDVQKANRLVEQGRCDCYLLLTNACVSGRTEQQIKARLREAGVKHAVCFGYNWVCQQICDSKRLRMFVPRVYGIGDLSQILDERAYDQAQALLASLREGLSKVILTGAYDKAARAIEQHGFVLLVGEPASGKTTTAAMLAMAAIDQWGVSTMKIDEPAKVADRWNPHEPSQFIWIDDAFGVTQYEPLLVYGWNRVFPQVKAMLKGGAKIIMTSRDYIYNRARKDLKESSFPLLKESQVVIDVRDLTIDEKCQILYNHIKLGTQSREFRSVIKPYLEQVAAHPRFAPETARRLGDSMFTGALTVDSWHIDEFVERQEEFLHEVLMGLDSDSKAAVALIFMRNGSLSSPIELHPSEAEALERLSSSLGGCTVALDALKDSLVCHVVEEGRALWRFKHPTIGDAFGSLLLQNPELMGLYLQGASVEKLVQQVTCGDLGLEHAVVVPASLFGLVIGRLIRFLNGQRISQRISLWKTRQQLEMFLARRCDKKFLELYIARCRETLERAAKPGLYLSAVSEVELAERLFELDLLPELYRRSFIETVSQYAIEGQDAYALRNPRLRAMFSESELAQLLARLRTELIPVLDGVRRNCQSDCAGNEDPGQFMEQFLDVLQVLEEEFSQEGNILRELRGQRQLVQEWIAERESEREDSTQPSRLRSDARTPFGRPAQERRVFDDIDCS